MGSRGERFRWLGPGVKQRQVEFAQGLATIADAKYDEPFVKIA